jgi:tRNA modification GTPase
VFTGWARDPLSRERIDQVVVFAFDPASSHTGQEAAEIHGHGGPAVLDRLLSAAIAAGAAPAPPGEFTRRAFLSGRIDLLQAEAVALIVAAAGNRAASASALQLAGGLSREFAASRSPLVTALSQLEATLDFPDDEIPPPDPASISQLLSQARERLGRLDPEPGTTRDYLEARMERSGIGLTLVDTAGLRQEPGRIEKAGMELSREAVRSADVLLLVVDASGITAEALNQLPGSSPGVRTIVAINKIDLDERMDPQSLSLLEPLVRFQVSALTGEGVSALASHLVDQEASHVDLEGPVLTCTRHRDLVSRAADDIDRATSAMRDGLPVEILAAEIRSSLAHIDELTGRETVPDVLDEIFSSFCIGK